tara:strand:- start:5039 stop:5776 length:738 start_codon:yes stop_codon:yes gene_type:complete
MSTLQKHFGREVKVYEIEEYGKTYFRLFYHSTGTGNEKFKGKFSNTLLPFYGMIDDEDKTLIKAIMIRNKVHKLHKMFRWQLDLLEYLSEKTDSLILSDMQILLDNYFNTPGEIIISIIDGKGFWENNINIADEIIGFFQKNEYEIHEIREIQDFDINNDTNELHNIENDKSILRKNWSESINIVAQKQQEERLNEKIAAIKNKAKKGGKKTKGKCKNCVKKTKRKSKNTVKGKKNSKILRSIIH